MEDVKKLLSDLHSKTPELRNSATMALWDCWYFEAGEVAKTDIVKGEDLNFRPPDPESREFIRLIYV